MQALTPMMALTPRANQLVLHLHLPPSRALLGLSLLRAHTLRVAAMTETFSAYMLDCKRKERRWPKCATRSKTKSGANKHKMR